MSENKFDRSSALWGAAAVCAVLACCSVRTAWADDALAAKFAAPPVAAHPETWFHLINGNVTKAGLTLDLEAIQRAGLSGIQLFHGNIGGRGLWPGVTDPVYCLSEKWEDHIRYAATECQRLGLTFRMQNCPGWSMSGGPWIKDGEAMRKLAYARAFVQGGKLVKKQIKMNGPDLHNVATVAFRVPEGDICPFTHTPGFYSPKGVSAPGPLEAQWKELFLKGKAFHLPVAPKGGWTVELDFGGAPLRTMEPPGVKAWASPRVYHDGVKWTITRVAPDGRETQVGSFKNPRATWQDGGNWSIALPDDAPYQKLRITIENEYPINLGKFTFISQAHPDNFEGESGRNLRSLVRRDPVALKSSAAVQEVLDLTAQTDAEGNVTWNAPEGNWEIFRIVHVRDNKRNGPAPVEATGWECDKLSPHGVNASFAGYIGKLTDPQKGVLKNGLLKGALFDSWECVTQNWTPGLDKKFEARYGYKLQPWFPAIIGYVVKDRESTSRFLRDWRVFLGDQIEKNFFGRVAELCHERKLDMSFETAFGDVLPGDILGYYRYCDVPMCEYWQPKSPLGHVGDSDFKDVRPTVSAAKMYGKRRVAAEAFTSFKLTWNESPRFFKSYHDEHYALGVTHPVFHTFTHHPQTDLKAPGTSFGGGIGSPFLRGQTWWPRMKAFTDYIARCTVLAESGETVSDILYYLGDEANAKPKFTLVDVPESYRYDYCNQDALLHRLTVKDGRWTLPSGASYAVLWLPDCEKMVPETLEGILRGVKAGGRVCGKRPKSIATLVGGCANEARFAKLVAEIWGGAYADRVSEGSLVAALKAAGCRGDVEVVSDDGTDWNGRTRDGAKGLVWSHRQAGTRHWYFFAAPAERGFSGKVVLRNGAAKRWTLWDAVTGKTRAAAVKPRANGDAEVALAFAPSESVFVVSDGDAVKALSAVRTTVALDDAWNVTFDKKGWGRDEALTLAKLVPWCELAGSDEAKSYSGTAVYRRTFNLPEAGAQTILDLGRVEVIAAVRINGQNAGTAWTWPYRLDVTPFVKAGANTIEVEVTGTWHNRLAFDSGLPEEQRKTWSRNTPKADAPRVPYGLLGPVKLEVR
ncbi:MAG: hypothetical protein MJ249_08790 [Kiritimatiellae bacterium]|nr:hypothetical protein [Kiritimatiellia bacterium]